MVGADESTELWRHPSMKNSFIRSVKSKPVKQEVTHSVIPPHTKEVSLTCLMDLRDKTVGPLSTEFPVDRMAFGQS